jgi:hypothetical protein
VRWLLGRPNVEIKRECKLETYVLPSMVALAPTPIAVHLPCSSGKFLMAVTERISSHVKATAMLDILASE